MRGVRKCLLACSVFHQKKSRRGHPHLTRGKTLKRQKIPRVSLAMGQFNLSKRTSTRTHTPWNKTSYKHIFAWQKSTPNMTGAKVPPYNGNDPPPAPGSLKALLFPPLLIKVENKGTQGVRARCGAELPPFISIVRCPGRPVILGMEKGVFVNGCFFAFWCSLGLVDIFKWICNVSSTRSSQGVSCRLLGGEFNNSLMGSFGKGSLQKSFRKFPRNFRKLSAEFPHPFLAQ